MGVEMTDMWLVLNPKARAQGTFQPGSLRGILKVFPRGVGGVGTRLPSLLSLGGGREVEGTFLSELLAPKRKGASILET